MADENNNNKKVTGLQHTIYEDEDEELYARLGESPVQLDTSVAKMIVIDNLPTVNAERYSKLEQVLKSILDQIGGYVDLHIPFEDNDDSKNTIGIAFVEYADANTAKIAVTKLQNYRLDKVHVLKVNSFTDYEKFDNMPAKFDPKDQKGWNLPPNLHWWLTDPECRDQYAILYDDITEIFWNVRYEPKPKSLYKRQKMTHIYLLWSPLGTYLGTLHPQGIILWCGEDWSDALKFQHLNVGTIFFSPKEKYLVSVSNDQVKPNERAIFIWEIATGIAKKMPVESTQQGPPFKWSHDDKFFAKIINGKIHVYETPKMALYENKALKVSNAVNFEWSPSDNIIVCWSPEDKDGPARVMLIDVTSRKLLRSHNLFQVQDLTIRWQSSGDYLCTKVDKTKSKATTFELYRMREKDIPIETLSDEYNNVKAFSWENGGGDRFGLIYKTGAGRYSVCFYTMGDIVRQGALGASGPQPQPTGIAQIGRKTVTSEEKKSAKKIVELEKRQADLLFWSPNGRFVVLVGMAPSLGGTMEFYDVDKLETMRTEQQAMVSTVEWDPSGRYIASAVSKWSHSLDNGYTVWSFQGKELFRVSREKFYQFAWRPRPPSLLSKDKINDIRKKDYSAKLKKQDREKKKALWDENQRLRNENRKDFLEIVAKNSDRWKVETRAQRRKMVGYLSDDEGEMQEIDVEVAEEIAKEHVELVVD